MKINTIIALLVLSGCFAKISTAATTVDLNQNKNSKSVSQISASEFIDNGVLENDSPLPDSLEISGILTDSTVTRFGHELFDAFNKHWRAPESVRYNISFNERNDPLRGSFVTVKLNEQQLFEGFLTPRDDAIQELGKGLAREIRSLVLSNANIAEELY